MFASVQTGQPVAGAPLPAVATPVVVTAAAFLQFTFAPANPVALGTSLLVMFPSIDRSVLLKVAWHEFKPSDLYKLDPRHKDRAARQILDVSSGVVLVRDHAPQDYPTFHALYIPLNMFFNVLAGFVATGGDAMALYQITSSSAAYLARIIQFSQDYQWSAVLAYHFDFHYKRHHDMLRGDYSGWATIDTGLQAEHLIGRERAHHSTAAKPAHNSQAKLRNSDEVCRNFNKGFCVNPGKGGHIHKCVGCGAADHSQSTCAHAPVPA
ncbi:hypothetical protein C8Q74DRAFT_1202393 [Fomes fomentarius]|nr:hypothetical protein C8Q74DRAFT_1202393 [Fomes fomentarius]